MIAVNKIKLNRKIGDGSISTHEIPEIFDSINKYGFKNLGSSRYSDLTIRDSDEVVDILCYEGGLIVGDCKGAGTVVAFENGDLFSVN
jgi:hypothetical protein